MDRWTKLGLTGISLCVALLLLTFFLARNVRNSPQEETRGLWDSRAIQSTFVGIRVRELDPAHATIVFFYDLDNKTNMDYQLTKGPGVVIMTRLEPGGSLGADQQIDLNSAAFLPAGNRSRVGLEITHPFNWPVEKGAEAEREFRKLVAVEVAGLDGFVLFDQSKRYEIELPAAWPGFPQPSSAAE